MKSKSLSTGGPQPALAPGDQVVRYVDGRPIPCTVVMVLDEERILIKADQWPAGYLAPVRTNDVVLVGRGTE